VRKDEPLFEISTDKVDAEIPSPVDGELTEIRVAEGETVQVNTVVAVIGGAVGAKAPMQAALVATRSELGNAPLAAATTSEDPRRSSPLVRRIAKENNIDLAGIPGTGSNGRITRDDIQHYMSQSTPAQAKPVAAPVSQAPLQKMSGDVVPMTKMRAIIAQRMFESKQAIPHAHSVYKVDMTRIVRLRDRERTGFEQRHGVKLTYMPFIAVAAIDALKRFPILNASLVGSNIHYHAKINLGIAVALEWGLIVPVVRESESQSFVGLARAMNDLAGRARSKKLLPNEVGGSTFTLTNPGVFGGEYGMPIINPPESAILAIGGLRKEPVVLTDSDENDTIAIRSVQHFCLGFDHRLIDGADSGKFMTEFKNALENWNRDIG
jgi:2-oxoglutarate dehydrogenase E2 component (dihydrolipoamide succinyltransferase)